MKITLKKVCGFSVKTDTNRGIVETWWDSQSKNFITQLKDAEGNELQCITSGDKAGAKAAHLEMVGE